MQVFVITMLIISQIVWEMQVQENLVLSSMTFAIYERNLHANADDATSSGYGSTYLKQNKKHRVTTSWLHRASIIFSTLLTN